MFLIIIRRHVRLDGEQDFLERYRADLSIHPDFLGETLTKLSDDGDIPEAMASLFDRVPNCHTYVNVARWRNWQSFIGQCQMTPGWFDEEIEVAPRQRAVLEVIEDVPVATTLVD